MTFSKNVFIVLLLALATGTLHELNAMDPTSLTGLEEKMLIVQLQKPGASDFQIYQLLSEATKDNPQLYLPGEVTCIIAMNVCELTKKLCKECDESLHSPYTLLNFIESNLKKSIGHAAIITTLKTCLNDSGKSLHEIQSDKKETIFCYLPLIKRTFFLDILKIFFSAAGDKAWSLITVRDFIDYTAPYLSGLFPITINELLSFAPSPEEQWKFICMENSFDQETVFYKLLTRPFTMDALKKLLDSAPDEPALRLLLNHVTFRGNTVKDLPLDKKVIDILKSYRPAHFDVDIELLLKKEEYSWVFLLSKNKKY